jgi:hypothetical protein
MKEKDLNKIAKIEKAIREKYGEEAIQNPKKNWDQEKENKYLEELKAFYKRSSRKKNTEIIGDIKVKKKKTSHNIERSCPVCGSYSFSLNDDVYMIKFNCCFNCYIQYVEGREERWKSGWRPNN